MSYLQNKKIKQVKIFKIASGAILLAILFFARAPIFDALSYSSGEIFRPVLSAGRGIGSWGRGLSAYFLSKKFLLKENESLQNELAELDLRMANYDVLVQENESLKNILARAPSDRRFILAAILAKPNQSPYDTLLLDIGEKDGVSSGSLVFARGYIPIGRIESVSPNTAKAVLFSSPGEKTQAVIPISLLLAERRDLFWELVGRGGGNFELLLPRDFILNKGDIATLPGLSNEAVAVTETILSDPRDPFKKALLKSPVNIQEIKFVQVELR